MTEQVKPEKLFNAALDARSKAYAPYSHFHVGAAVESVGGQIYCGCNVENASYGLTNCAERSAIFNAISSGESKLLRLLVVADTPKPVAPCGACLQVMREFNIQEIILCNITGDCMIVGMAELLPYGFGPEQMKGAARNE